jgi:hypothetical protein
MTSSNAAATSAIVEAASAAMDLTAPSRDASNALWLAAIFPYLRKDWVDSLPFQFSWVPTETDWAGLVAQHSTATVLHVGVPLPSSPWRNSRAVFRMLSARMDDARINPFIGRVAAEFPLLDLPSDVLAIIFGFSRKMAAKDFAAEMEEDRLRRDVVEFCDQDRQNFLNFATHVTYTVQAILDADLSLPVDEEAYLDFISGPREPELFMETYFHCSPLCTAAENIESSAENALAVILEL